MTTHNHTVWYVFNGDDQLEAGPYTERDHADDEVANLLREYGDRNYRVVAGAS